MKTTTVLVILISFLFSPATAHANQKCEQSYELDQGDSSPCWGVLMPQPWVLKGLECIRVDLPHQTKKLELFEKKLNAEIEALKEELELAYTVMDNQSLMLDQALDAYEPPAWYSSPWLWGTVGFVAGVSGTAALAISLR